MFCSERDQKRERWEVALPKTKSVRVWQCDARETQRQSRVKQERGRGDFGVGVGQEEGPSPHTELCTYILDIVSGYGLVLNIDRPLGYYYDIQPFHPRSVLQGGRRRGRVGGENMTEHLRLWL